MKNVKRGAIGRILICLIIILSTLFLAHSANGQPLAFNNRPIEQGDPLLDLGGELHIGADHLRFQQSTVIQRDVQLDGPMLLSVSHNKTAHLKGNITINPSPIAATLFKFGQGTLRLSGQNHFYGGIVMAEGALRVDSLSAINGRHTQFVMMPGAQLDFAPGLRVYNQIHLLEDEQHIINLIAHPPRSTPAATNYMTLHIPEGDVYQMGYIATDERYAIHKTGAGNLHIEGPEGGAYIQGDFHIREGTLSVLNRSTGRITVHPGATIRSAGYVFNLRLLDGARLEPMRPGDTFRVWSSLRLAPQSISRIWLSNNQKEAPLYFNNDAHLDGILLVTLSDDFAGTYPYVVVKAPNGYSGRFAELIFSNPQGDMPSLQYQAQQIVLDYDASPTQPEQKSEPEPDNKVKQPPAAPPAPPVTPVRLDTGIAAYNQIAAQQLGDSRFIREAVAGQWWDNPNASTAAAHNGGHHNKGLWARSFHADLHQHAKGDWWDQERRTEGLLMGYHTHAAQRLRYGVQLGLQQSRWNSTTAEAQATWHSYTLGASIASPENATVSWHAGIAYSHLRTKHQREAFYQALSQQHRQHQWQFYAEARPEIYKRTQPNSATTWYGIGQFAQIQQTGGHSIETWNGSDALGLKQNNASATLVGLGLGMQHRFQARHGDTTVNVRLLRQQAIAGSTLHAYYRDESKPLHSHRLNPNNSLNAWQLDLNVHGQLTKRSQLSMELSQRYQRKRLDHTINLHAQLAF